MQVIISNAEIRKLSLPDNRLWPEYIEHNTLFLYSGCFAMWREA